MTSSYVLARTFDTQRNQTIYLNCLAETLQYDIINFSPFAPQSATIMRKTYHLSNLQKSNRYNFAQLLQNSAYLFWNLTEQLSLPYISSFKFMRFISSSTSRERSRQKHSARDQGTQNATRSKCNANIKDNLARAEFVFELLQSPDNSKFRWWQSCDFLLRRSYPDV